MGIGYFKTKQDICYCSSPSHNQLNPKGRSIAKKHEIFHTMHILNYTQNYIAYILTRIHRKVSRCDHFMGDMLEYLLSKSFSSGKKK